MNFHRSGDDSVAALLGGDSADGQSSHGARSSEEKCSPRPAEPQGYRSLPIVISFVVLRVLGGCPSFVLSEVLEYPGSAHASADAHGHQSVARATPLHLANNAGSQFSSSAAQWVS
jgi:hypothetical protein